MGLISTIKSLLGVGGGDRSRDAGTPVAVEREPAATAERAVKGVDETPPTADGAPSGTDGEPVDAIKGVGPSYAERLAAAGVDTVEDLAAADADALAAETDIGAGRLENWIEQARARSG